MDCSVNDTDQLARIDDDQKQSEHIEKQTKEETPKRPKISFKCEQCGFSETCDYKGKKPHFAKNIQFHEDCYVMQDPFSPPPSNITSKSNSEYFIVIGADCSNCGNSVCSTAACSIFYKKSYCANCAYQLISMFPLEIQTKIRKTMTKIT